MIGPNSSHSTVSGGLRNSATAAFATVPGGRENIASKMYSLATGYRARAAHQSAFVWADSSLTNPFTSTANHQFLIRARGGVGINTNNPQGNALFVNGPARINGNLAVTSINGRTNFVGPAGPAGAEGPVGPQGPAGPTGGVSPTINTDSFAYVGGGASNAATGPYSSIGGGQVNEATNTWSTVGGGFSNRAAGLSAFVGGGEQNLASAKYSAVGAGAVNQATAEDASVFAGFFNKADADQSFVGGGQQNRASGPRAVVVGGNLNEASAPYSAVAGGSNNLILNTANGGTIGGGELNTVEGTNATVPGGSDNQASGTASFAAGVNAKAVHNYSFVWGGSPDVDTVSTNPMSYTARAPGGFRLMTSTNDIAGLVLPANSSTWASLSDSNAKTDIRAVDYRNILAKVAALPVTEWRYKHDPTRRYIGPMAQDFHAAFGLGFDDKHISTLDTDGVTLAAIKGLVEEIKVQDQVLSEREAQINRLEESLQKLRDQLPPSSNPTF